MHGSLYSSLFHRQDGKTRRWMGLAVGVVAIAVGTTSYQAWRSQSSSAATPVPTVAPPTIRTVTALGRLEPNGEVIRLSAPTSTTGNRIAQVLVAEGDRVKVGQVIAILDSRDELQAAYEQARGAVQVAQAQLAITQAGAKQGEINAQRAEIARLEAQRQGDITAQAATVARLSSEVQNAQSEFARYQSLYQNGAISASTLDSKRLAVETAERSWQESKAVLARIQATSPAQVNQARATLARIAEVRPVDVQASRAEVNRAIAAMQQARAALDKAYVRSPINGEVLAIHARPGEVVGNDGIAEIGQTNQMYAVAEVYQSDINKVRLGQPVRLTSDSIPGELSGTVQRIDSQVKRQTIVNTDPSSNIDSRVIEVHIALDSNSSQRAAKFTNLQVTAVVQVGDTASATVSQ